MHFKRKAHQGNSVGDSAKTHFAEKGHPKRTELLITVMLNSTYDRVVTWHWFYTPVGKEFLKSND